VWVVLRCFVVAWQAIRANPDRKPKSDKPHDLKYKKPTRRSLAQRKDRVKQKKASRLQKLAKAAEEDD
jgi:hypothetical protein